MAMALIRRKSDAVAGAQFLGRFAIAFGQPDARKDVEDLAVQRMAVRPPSSLLSTSISTQKGALAMPSGERWVFSPARWIAGDR